ncbi:helix-turn-helix domain-containing protein [Bradyrhizobium sp. 41S5]|uniref:helix-turn-helix domain-containing protein n=1 Tax=Bradyrhizobium sp. 41S5 TaxID=1404443 RepID=UPI0015956B69|nr:helix-turn-helix domain-containing protein [Bradyrhizobium sp. 41S5]UFX41775.1 helix-turn-helix domain-containing protein [Bradyrhizobium sp. 41S5]
MSVYDLMRQRCGLSQTEAAEFQGVRLDTVKSWCSGRRPAPARAVDELRDLYRRILEAGASYAAQLERRGPHVAEDGSARYLVGEPRDDQDAIVQGWPNKAACLAALGVAIAALPVDAAPELVPHDKTTGIPRVGKTRRS